MTPLDPQPAPGVTELSEIGGEFGYLRQFMEVGQGYDTQFWPAPEGVVGAEQTNGIWHWRYPK